jgi:thiol-disulfide isomerase/thioredoxin
LSFKPTRHILSRRSIIATTAGLAASVSLGKFAAAQISESDLPDASAALTQTMPSPVPKLSFTDAKGKKLNLADYAGHGLLVNLWATWCGPCVAEIPSFAAIAPALARHKILVLPISVDMEGAAAVQPFYASHHITTLPVLLDTDGAAMDTLNADGIPLTLILNPDGKVVARLEGAANWNTQAAITLIRQLAGPKAASGGGITPV